MGQLITDRIDFSAILPANYPPAGSFIVGLDTADDVLKKMDSAGSITVVGGAFDYNSPAFTGTPTAPTASIGTNTTQLATTAFVLANAGSGGGITDITYAALKNLKDTSAMAKGYYRITDFTTIYDQPDFDTGGMMKYSVVVKTSAVEPLIVFAVSASELAAEAYSENFPMDKIKYDINYTATEIMAAPAKGRIIERIDDKNNRTDYDHRTVLFLRYDIDGYGNYVSYKETAFLPAQEFLTFSGPVALNNYIGDYAAIVPLFAPGSFILANNVFKNITVFNRFGDLTVNNTAGGVFEVNTFKFLAQGNVFLGAAITNHFGYELILCTFGASFQGNILGDVCQNCVFGQNIGELTLKTNCTNLVIPDGSNNVEFGNNSTNVNTFTSSLSNNKFGDNTLSGQDFSAATRVYAPYFCEIQVADDLNPILMYPTNIGWTYDAINS
jgi:hypothetical protein